MLHGFQAYLTNTLCLLKEGKSTFHYHLCPCGPHKGGRVTGICGQGGIEYEVVLLNWLAKLIFSNNGVTLARNAIYMYVDGLWW